MTQITQAMLLAAGKGLRLRPVTAKIPKPLVPVGGRPMVERVLDLMSEAGIRHVHMNSHHLGHLLPENLGDGSRWGFALDYHPEETILGTGGGLLGVKNECPQLVADGPFLMINSDILMDLDLEALLRDHLQHEPLATLVLRPDPRARDYGVIAPDDHGRIRRFLTVNTGGATQEMMFTGVQVLSPRIFEYMPDHGGEFPITDTYMKALAAGETLRAFVHHGYWNDLGTPARLMEAEADIAAGRVITERHPAT